MAEITLSHMETHPLFLDEFKAASQMKVSLQTMSWSKAWSELLSVALFGSGPDISQIGSTWLGSLCSMNALHLFTDAELRKLNAPQAFLPVFWSGSSLPGERGIYAIPFTTDTRILLYRRDLLARAGVDETTAFQTNDHLYETLARLQAAGIEIPWLVSTVDEVHHNLAPWIWGAGGDFHTPGGFHLNLTDERTIEGIYQFYRLHRFIPPQAQSLSLSEVDVLFRRGKGAVAYTIHSTLNRLSSDLCQVPKEHIGAAKVPGVPFVGGSQLVIWKHTAFEEIANELIRYLTSPQYQRKLQTSVGDLPVLNEVLADEPYKSDPLFQVSAESLRTGRIIQPVPRWAAVEMRLTTLLQQLWQAVFADPDLNLRKEIEQRVAELTKKLEKTILAE